MEIVGQCSIHFVSFIESGFFCVCGLLCINFTLHLSKQDFKCILGIKLQVVNQQISLTVCFECAETMAKHLLTFLVCLVVFGAVLETSGRPSACDIPMYIDLVCGTDGATYSNIHALRCDQKFTPGLEVKHWGGCP